MNGLMFLHRPCSGTAPVTLPLTYAVEAAATATASALHQFSIVSIYVLTQTCEFENKYAKKKVFFRERDGFIKYPVALLSAVLLDT